VILIRGIEAGSRPFKRAPARSKSTANVSRKRCGCPPLIPVGLKILRRVNRQFPATVSRSPSHFQKKKRALIGAIEIECLHCKLGEHDNEIVF
jgi:hypothetical protein